MMNKRRPSFRMVKDPVTGILDMIPIKDVVWGDRKPCIATTDALGQMRFDQVSAMTARGGMVDIHDLHDAALVDITSLLAPHVEDHMLTGFVRSWIDAAALVRDGSHDSATVTTGVPMDGVAMRVAVSIADSDIIVSIMTSEEGRALAAPQVYWNNSGELGSAEIKRNDVEPWMIDADLLSQRADATRTVAAARRKSERATTLGFVDMFAWRTLRTMKAA